MKRFFSSLTKVMTVGLTIVMTIVLTIVMTIGLAVSLAGCDNGTTSSKGSSLNGPPEIPNTFYIGRDLSGRYTEGYLYIGTYRTDSNTPASVYSMPGYTLQVGWDWDNTPDWKKEVEKLLTNIIVEKDGRRVSYSDLPDYSGTGEKNNREQHNVFSVGTLDTRPPSAKLQGKWYMLSVESTKEEVKYIETWYYEFSGDSWHHHLNSDNVDTMQPGQYKDYGGTFTCTDNMIVFDGKYFTEYDGRGYVEYEWTETNYFRIGGLEYWINNNPNNSFIIPSVLSIGGSRWVRGN